MIGEEIIGVLSIPTNTPFHNVRAHIMYLCTIIGCWWNRVRYWLHGLYLHGFPKMLACFLSLNELLRIGSFSRPVMSLTYLLPSLKIDWAEPRCRAFYYQYYYYYCTRHENSCGAITQATYLVCMSHDNAYQSLETRPNFRQNRLGLAPGIRRHY